MARKTAIRAKVSVKGGSFGAQDGDSSQSLGERRFDWRAKLRFATVILHYAGLLSHMAVLLKFKQPFFFKS
ncbi:hypothetical protein D1B31_21315 [Neobacillus notoginsengisoli]|uniref:Uncharacterized protein n=1 Tax=Neobacillus notoginsengisoli TaxID=1578198 RepID=A0A417YHV2_9BACI|nr:hypothetical protein [Neobacillus notoginsengisoli]RHW32465.1 hypothetical protein D1B31_21315 [Neobacillus notoginsengisoli]